MNEMVQSRLKLDPEELPSILAGLKPTPVKPSILSVVAQMKVGKEDITALALKKEAVFAEVVAALLNTDTYAVPYGLLLQERRYAMPSVLIGQVVVHLGCDSNAIIRTDGYGNLFFLQKEDGSVEIRRVYRVRDGSWHKVDSDLSGMDFLAGAGFRLFVRNFDASKL